jgi:hypothetical protein
MKSTRGIYRLGSLKVQLHTLLEWNLFAEDAIHYKTDYSNVRNWEGISKTIQGKNTAGKFALSYHSKGQEFREYYVGIHILWKIVGPNLHFQSFFGGHSHFLCLYLSHNNQPFVIALVNHTLWIPKEIAKMIQ